MREKPRNLPTRSFLRPLAQAALYRLLSAETSSNLKKAQESSRKLKQPQKPLDRCCNFAPSVHQAMLLK